jgi:hypoxanthine-DNA glycosylase
MAMSTKECFPPIARKDAKVLILGSMPSETSLLKQEYYGHPRNSFWPIMGELFSALPELPYRQRKTILMEAKIAVWDVLKTCRRPGSMDSEIDMSSIETNNFYNFFVRYPLIRNIFFNGGKAESVFRKFIAPGLSNHSDYLQFQRLPSTSPAYASMNFEQKLSAWYVVKQASVINEE